MEVTVVLTLLILWFHPSSSPPAENLLTLETREKKRWREKHGTREGKSEHSMLHWRECSFLSTMFKKDRDEYLLESQYMGSSWSLGDKRCYSWREKGNWNWWDSHWSYSYWLLQRRRSLKHHERKRNIIYFNQRHISALVLLWQNLIQWLF